MSSLGTIRQQVLDLIRQSATDTQVSTTQLNSWINLALELAATIIEWPRKKIVAANPAQGVSTIAKPSDFISLYDAYYGDPAVSGDIRPMTIITMETLKDLNPRWLDATSSNQGRPQYIAHLDQSNFTIVPAPDSVNAGKPLTIIYVYNQAALAADSDVPVLPLVFHDILQFLAAHFYYENMTDPKMAKEMLDNFNELSTKIKLSQTKETTHYELQWGADLDDVNADYPVSGNIIP